MELADAVQVTLCGAFINDYEPKSRLTRAHKNDPLICSIARFEKSNKTR
jgi:hypothetical protein